MARYDGRMARYGGRMARYGGSKDTNVFVFCFTLFRVGGHFFCVGGPFFRFGGSFFRFGGLFSVLAVPRAKTYLLQNLPLTSPECFSSPRPTQ